MVQAAKRTCVAGVVVKVASSCAKRVDRSVRSWMCASAPVAAASSTCVIAGTASWEDRARAGVGAWAKLASSRGVAGAGAPAWVAAFLCARPLREAAGAGAVAGVEAAATCVGVKAEGACGCTHTSEDKPAAS